MLYLQVDTFKLWVDVYLMQFSHLSREMGKFRIFLVLLVCDLIGVRLLIYLVYWHPRYILLPNCVDLNGNPLSLGIYLIDIVLDAKYLVLKICPNSDITGFTSTATV